MPLAFEKSPGSECRKPVLAYEVRKTVAEEQQVQAAAMAAAILGFPLPHTSGQLRQIKHYMAGILRTGEYAFMDPNLQDRLMNLLAVISDTICAKGPLSFGVLWYSGALLGSSAGLTMKRQKPKTQLQSHTELNPKAGPSGPEGRSDPWVSGFQGGFLVNNNDS